MKVIVHYPEDEHGREALMEKVAVLHGEYIYSYLKGLNVPSEKKLEILDSEIARENN